MNGWPMVGRAEEQRFISEVIANPDRSGVLLAGRAGVGKTRLIREVLRSTPDHHVEWVTASESVRPLPFGALAHLLPSSLHDVEQVDLLGVLGHSLQRRAEGQPVVLAVDDVHLLDGLSAGFVDYVAIRRLGTVVLTLRSGSALPDALEGLCRSSGIPRLELQALSRSEFLGANVGRDTGQRPLCTRAACRHSGGGRAPTDSRCVALDRWCRSGSAPSRGYCRSPFWPCRFSARVLGVALRWRTTCSRCG
jgi:hypothetical protein